MKKLRVKQRAPICEIQKIRPIFQDQHIRPCIGRDAEHRFKNFRRAYVPEDIIALLDELFTVVLDGRNAKVASGVEEALGRPARDFADFARAAAATGVWG